jgi:hypothetical protein
MHAIFAPGSLTTIELGLDGRTHLVTVRELQRSADRVGLATLRAGLARNRPKVFRTQTKVWGDRLFAERADRRSSDRHRRSRRDGHRSKPITARRRRRTADRARLARQRRRRQQQQQLRRPSRAAVIGSRTDAARDWSAASRPFLVLPYVTTRRSCLSDSAPRYLVSLGELTTAWHGEDDLSVSFCPLAMGVRAQAETSRTRRVAVALLRPLRQQPTQARTSGYHRNGRCRRHRHGRSQTLF